MEGRSGLDLLKDLQSRFPKIPVLVHSMHDEVIYAERAISAGARGYLMKHEAGGKLATAVRAILRGETYLSERLSTLGSGSSKKQGTGKPVSGREPISPKNDSKAVFTSESNPGRNP